MTKQLQIPGIGGVLPGELIVDLFAGGGGASAGIEAALGRPPDIAINHDPHAIQMHERNHPATRHYCQSVFHREVHPRTLVAGQCVGLLWLSPDCRHFSRARGGAPVSASVRALCWIGLRWAKFVRPRVVILENVAEFTTAGPLLSNGQPNKKRAGEHFRAFLREWKRYGYTVDQRELVCAYHGAKTTRKRLFMVMRCDGEPIRWMEDSEKPAGTAADCIDWSLPCPSIFMTRAEAREFKRRTGIVVKRPLAANTMRRIARGIVKYVLNGKPFLVQIGARHGRGDAPVDQPLSTVMPTQRQALIAPSLVQTGYGEREGQAPRCLDIHQPLGTATAGGCKHALVAAFLAKHNGGHEATGQTMAEPVHTLTTTDQKAVVAAHLSVFRQNSTGVSPDEPVPTLTAGGGHGGGSMALVAAFLQQYYSEGGQDQSTDAPLATVPTRARHSVVIVTIDGTDYAITDIGMRMLEPRELARAQGFPDNYILTGTKAQQIARIGNSVCPPVAEEIVRAQFAPEIEARRRKVGAA